MAAFLDGLEAAVPSPAGRMIRALAAGDVQHNGTAIDRVCDPSQARALQALLRDTISPNVVHAGVKYNVIPGEAVIELDCRPLPGTSEAEMRGQVMDRLGDLAEVSSLELLVFGPPVEGSAATELYDALAGTIADHDP